MPSLELGVLTVMVLVLGHGARRARRFFDHAAEIRKARSVTDDAASVFRITFAKSPLPPLRSMSTLSMGQACHAVPVDLYCTDFLRAAVHPGTCREKSGLCVDEL